MMFNKIGTVILLVQNMERSLNFYSDVLGLKIKTKSTDWIEFFDKGTTLALHPMRKKTSNTDVPKPSVLVGFMVDNLDDVVNLLRSKNVKFFKDPKEEPFGKHTIVLDPDENLISIAEIHSKASNEGFDLVGFFGAE